MKIRAALSVPVPPAIAFDCLRHWSGFDEGDGLAHGLVEARSFDRLVFCDAGDDLTMTLIIDLRPSVVGTDITAAMEARPRRRIHRIPFFLIERFGPDVLDEATESADLAAELRSTIQRCAGVPIPPGPNEVQAALVTETFTGGS